MKFLRLPLVACLYFSLATVLAEAAALAVTWSHGGITKDRWIQIVATAEGVDLAEMWDTIADSTSDKNNEQASYEEVLLARTQTNVDLDLREMGFDKGWIDIRNLEFMLRDEKDRYAQLKLSFDQQMEQLRQGADDTALQEVQRQLESVDPKLAKDQILRILDDPNIPPDTSMHFVVTMFKNMTLDRRKRIISTLRTDDQEAEQLHDILRQIRLGMPEVSLIRDTRKRLQEFKRKG